MVVAQLAQQSLPIPEVHSSNPVIWKILKCTLDLLTVEKRKLNKKRSFLLKNYHIDWTKLVQVPILSRRRFHIQNFANILKYLRSVADTNDGFFWWSIWDDFFSKISGPFPVWAKMHRDASKKPKRWKTKIAPVIIQMLALIAWQLTTSLDTVKEAHVCYIGWLKVFLWHLLFFDICTVVQGIYNIHRMGFNLLWSSLGKIHFFTFQIWANLFVFLIISGRFLKQIIVKILHLASGARIWTHNLLVVELSLTSNH